MDPNHPHHMPKALPLGQPELADLSLYYCEFPNEEKTQQDWINQYQQLLPDNLSRASQGRQAEFIAGRLAAKAALTNCGIPGCYVASREDRSPVWPDGICGSISHKKHMAVAAVSESADFLGLDLEIPMTENAANKLSRKIINDTEIQILHDSSIAFAEGFTRVFSAKEALYKAVYPYVQRYLPFSVCEITAITEDSLTLQLQSDLAIELDHKPSFVVHHITLPSQFLSLLIASR